MKKSKAVLSLIVIIFFAGLCVAPIYAQAPQRSRRPAMQNQSQIPVKALDLSDDQMEALKNLREAQKEILNGIREKAQNLREELEGLRKDPEKNRALMENIQDELFNLRIEQMKSQYAHGKEIRKVFTPEQLEKMSLMRSIQMRRGQAMNRRSGGQGRLRRFPLWNQRDFLIRPPLRRWRR